MKPSQSPAPVTESPAEALKKIADKQAALRADSAAQLQALELQKQEIEALQHPLFVILKERTALLIKIGNAETYRVTQAGIAKRWRARLDECFEANDFVQGRGGDLWQVYVHGDAKTESLALSLIPELDRYLADRRAEVPAIEQKIFAYAAANHLEPLLPADLKAAA
jgi:hypothetical protein